MRRFYLAAFAVSALIISAQGFANDTSFPMINVDWIESNAKLGSEVTFSGPEALELLKVLPQVSTTGGPEVAKNRRSLVVRSGDLMVHIGCSRYHHVNGETVVGTPRCWISYNHYNGDLDGFPFKAESVCRAE